MLIKNLNLIRMMKKQETSNLLSFNHSLFNRYILALKRAV